ncbi:hypothetical protein [Pseudobacteroides cellulosolvens]|uniref:Uncharacterized protein n=1 Tax=Pseudobacteroides cellulosolvens ATCC 35603 = DSM 2933 TaxID=398512 RepID=A0A0L6JKF1_9FIRM|nr:hypothetical protein [Pseudobacteroides cellulosolvens]KNY26336.1 hypothetical protein Bccel_1598 [Pseudobacteroides cellulosolvens ATCC 35603 = DSM 2933]
MDFNEIKTFIESNKDSNEELKTYLQGLWKLGRLTICKKKLIQK